MYELIIQNYIQKLNKNDITYFALKNNISLNDNEIDYILNTLKNSYQTLLSNNYETILNEAKTKLNSDNYQKIYKLFINYRNKYQNFL